MLALTVAVLLGAAGWTLLEYMLHRFVFHARSPRGPGAMEHRRHHAQPGYFAPAWQKVLAALVATILLLPLVSALAGFQLSAAGTLGFIATYLLYEVLHRRVHTRAPRNRYGRWRRKHHLAHHFVNPRLAQGVTTPFWDTVFGTQLAVERVRVPRRLAMPWLVDTSGQILPEYAADYELVESRAQNDCTLRSDIDTAMANERPEV